MMVLRDGGPDGEDPLHVHETRSRQRASFQSARPGEEAILDLLQRVQVHRIWPLRATQFPKSKAK